MIFIEPLNPVHASSIFHTIDKYRNELRVWLPFVDHTQEIEDSLNFIRYSSSTGDLTFAVFYDNCFAGLAGIKDIDQSNRKAEIGYWISPEFQNKGIATTVSEFLVRYGFHKLGLNRIQIRIGTHNTHSNRVAEKLHFKFEGIQRDGELLISGFHDLNVFSLLQKEYNN